MYECVSLGNRNKRGQRRKRVEEEKEEKKRKKRGREGRMYAVWCTILKNTTSQVKSSQGLHM